MAVRRTLARKVSVTGKTLHGGVTAAMTLSPAAGGSGIRFRRSDLPQLQPIPALWSAVAETRLGTVIRGDDGATAGVIEHLMAALAGAEIDDCLVELDAPEPPILEGDALSYLQLIDEAGIAENAGSRQVVRVLKPVGVAHRDATATLIPADAREFAFEIDFPSAAVGRQTLAFVLTGEDFRREIAPARTFGFLAEAEALRKAGFARGADLGNTLVIDGDTVLNPALMRYADEFVRHKILDAIGDLKLAGAPILGRFEGRRSSHALNNAVLRALFADPSNYERVSS